MCAEPKLERQWYCRSAHSLHRDPVFSECLCGEGVLIPPGGAGGGGNGSCGRHLVSMAHRSFLNAIQSL